MVINSKWAASKSRISVGFCKGKCKIDTFVEG